MKARKPNEFLIIAAVLATAVLSYFGTGLHPLWPLLWFAPVPVLALAPRLGPGRAFLIAFVAWFLGEMNLWKHLAYGIGLPLPLIVASFLISASFSVLACCCAQFSATRFTLPRRACVSNLPGDLRIPDRDCFASQHVRQSFLHADELSARDPNRFDHRNLGNQFCCLSLCRPRLQFS